MNTFDTMDGNQAAAYVSYALTEVAAIYPITPSSPMAESMDEWAANGRKNIFSQTVNVVEMQSEAGAAGAMHGSLQGGALTSTYTASQGLLLMIPNIYKMVGELLPGVLHVTARAIATHALSIFGDHQDVMACRQTGACMLASSSVQEAMDLGLVAHLSAIEARLPFIHFFDGFRTSHEVQKISVIPYDEIAKVVNFKAIEDFRRRALNPEHPVVRGTAQNPDIYFQGREVQNKYFDAAPQIVANNMSKLYGITGRQYHPFDYYGAPDAENIVIAMGSICDTAYETVDYLRSKGEKAGAIKVHLYRPFSVEHFFAVLPKTVKRIAVLDRTKEPGATGEPLYLDVAKAFYQNPMKPLLVGGRYGLGSKDTRPTHILSVFQNLKQESPKDRFTIGIQDDVTHLSLPEIVLPEDISKDTVNCVFWGLGSDGTVGANKAAIKIIGNHTDLYAQGYFAYDSKKSGGLTMSHLRFGKNPIRSPYLVTHPDYVACHNKAYVISYDILKGIQQKGVFVLNCDWSQKELDEILPASMKRTIVQKNIEFYTIDAISIAQKLGLGNRINMIMQAAFFKLVNIIPAGDAANYLKESIQKTYGKKGQKIVDMNNRAVDAGMDSLSKVNVPDSWRNAADSGETPDTGDDFITRIHAKMARQSGDELPVSAFNGMEDGSFPLGTTAFEKRGIAVTLPEWQIDRCIQCGFCSYICPHATIRLMLLNKEEEKNKPDSFKTKKASGKELEQYKLRVQISPYDCTGCGNCADICPAKDKALIMRPSEEEIEAEAKNWEYAMTISEKSSLMGKNSIKGSQLAQPHLEFNGACPGCGETPYIKLITQLFGDRMMIANATGCSSIWGASAPSIAYTTNDEGKGPAWANSLFEDNAEYGFGMYLGVSQVRNRIKSLMLEALQQDIDAKLKDAFSLWIAGKEDAKGSSTAAKLIQSLMENQPAHPLLDEIKKLGSFLVKRSVWIVGGDGWAYDIGYGGVDHVLSTGEDVNLFVMDTEVYSNTGGQASKSTPYSAVAKFTYKGKRARKKDLGRMAMTYGSAYVAQISMGANMKQTLTAILEAEAYKGPSIIIAYAPCINHGIKTGMGTSILEEKKAVESGYWHLYRYNPDLAESGKNPFILDSKDPTRPYLDFIKGEMRYTQLQTVFPDIAEDMFTTAEKQAKERLEAYKQLAAQQPTP